MTSPARSSPRDGTRADVGSLSVIAVAGAVTVAVGGGVGMTRGRLRGGLAVQAAGMALLGVVGVAALTGGGRVGSGFRSAVAPALGVDPLSGFFLAVLALTAIPTLVFARDYLRGGAAIGASAR